MFDLELMLNGYRITTAEIIYRLPDHPQILQSYIWQDLDKDPNFPKLAKFLAFWQKELDGKLFSVRVSSSKLIRPTNYNIVTGEFSLS